MCCQNAYFNQDWLYFVIRSYYQVSTGTRFTFAAVYFGLMIVSGVAMTFVLMLHAPDAGV